MAEWQTAAAKQNFSKLVAAAASGGPQLVARHKEPVAVVMSPDDYRALVRQARSGLAQVILSAPFEEGEIDGVAMALGDADLESRAAGNAA